MGKTKRSIVRSKTLIGPLSTSPTKFCSGYRLLHESPVCWIPSDPSFSSSSFIPVIWSKILQKHKEDQMKTQHCISQLLEQRQQLEAAQIRLEQAQQEGRVLSPYKILGRPKFYESPRGKICTFKCNFVYCIWSEKLCSNPWSLHVANFVSSNCNFDSCIWSQKLCNNPWSLLHLLILPLNV